ncbi:MAG: S53 family peptidase [Terriglobales bacterium]
MARIPDGYRRLEGSERHPAPGTKRLGPADPAEEFSVTVRVRRRKDGPPLPDHAHWMGTPPTKRTFLTHEDFEKKFGAAQEDLDAVASFARGHGMTVKQTTLAGRTILLSGTVKQMGQAFAVELGRYKSSQGIYRGRDGFVYVPDELADIVVAVFGLDNRRVGFRNGGDPPGTVPFTVGGPTTISQFYNFPQAPPYATGQRIGVLEFAPPGGWTQPDVQATLNSWFASDTNPTIIDVPSTANPQISDSETILDICTASAVAPGATIQVYWGADSTSAQDWFNIINRIFHSPQSGDPPHPQVLSISWTLIGGDDFITTAGIVSSATVDEISSDFKEMALAGITIFAASGDGGSLGWNNTMDAPPGALGKAHVAYPASDPWVTSCGGTSTGQTASVMLGEEWVWNDTYIPSNAPGATGGGISAFFTNLPQWQVGIVNQLSLASNAVGRGVPDVAGNASLNSGYQISLNLQFSGPYCGTSAVAPLYAGLVAMINARLGETAGIGFLNPTLYALRDTIFVDINDQIFLGQGAPADNSFGGSPGYPSGPGWDACTGLGRIDGSALLAALQSGAGPVPLPPTGLQGVVQ